MSNNHIRAVMEALLFVSEKPVLIEQIHSVFKDLDSAAIRKILKDLEAEYSNSERGMRILEVAGGFQMVTAAELNAFLKKFYRRPPERLSGPSMETLSIIAYKQPITRIDIENLRGVDVSGIVNNLINKGLVRISGRKKTAGRPFVYATTRQFLEYFGLKSLEELPKFEEFAKSQNTPSES